MAKRNCAQCHGKLGLGVRFRNLWNGFGWVHLRFCSSYCEANFELEKRNTTRQDRWYSYLGST